jgi:hypothetical protein
MGAALRVLQPLAIAPDLGLSHSGRGVSGKEGFRRGTPETEGEKSALRAGTPGGANLGGQVSLPQE